MDEIYKDYRIYDQANDWGYFEAHSEKDCDAPIVVARTMEQLKIEIDELE
tara:strand:+ start:218 stop:367 length:150 start_codon:yes stop_codon:yes gene_type:complete